MIQVNDHTFLDVEEAIIYFEPVVRRLTNSFIYNSSEKDDCRQDLRMRLWKMYDNQERTYNEGYISKRLKFDIINFIQRNAGYNWGKKFTSINTLKEQELDLLMVAMQDNNPESVLDKIYLEEILVQASKGLTPRQYECLVLFLSGAPSDMIRHFLGTRSRNMTRFYLLLAESLAIVKEVINEKPID